MRVSPEEIRTYGFFLFDNGLIWVTPMFWRDPNVLQWLQWLVTICVSRYHVVASGVASQRLSLEVGHLLLSGFLSTNS